MKRIIYATVIIVCLITPVRAVQIGDFDYPETELREMRNGLDRWRRFALSAPSMKPEEAIPRLARGLLRTSMQSSYVVGDREAVYEELRAAMLAIPGHAQFLKDKVTVAGIRWDNFKKGENTPYNDVGPPMEVADAFDALGRLPTAETVRVLGELLYDEHGIQEQNAPYRPGEDVPNPLSYQSQAVLTLDKLPIKNKPVARAEHLDKRLTAWKAWHQEVKAGRRTFSFEGDPAVYNFQGPAREAKDPETRRAASHAPIVGDKTQPAGDAIRTTQTNLPYLMGAIVALLSLVAYLWQRREQRTQG